MKNKGFTLVELLVVIVILGVITGISIPLLRNVQSKMVDKKYTTYYDSLKNSAKLYNDSYNDDMFGHDDSGVYCVTFDELKEKKLIKDISIDDVTCARSDTLVRVVKLNDKYVYTPHLSCGPKGKAADVNLPKGTTISDINSYCSYNSDSNINISADLSYKGTSYNKRRKKTKLIISSATGIYNSTDNPVRIKTKWSTSATDFTDDGLQNQPINVKLSNSKQKEKILSGGGDIVVESDEIITPDAGLVTRSYYLIVKVESLQDLSGKPWKQSNGSKYLSFGPFTIDNEPPTCPQIVAVSNNKNYTPGTWTNNDIKFTFNFDSDVNTWEWYTNTGTGQYTFWETNSKTTKTKTISGEGIRHIKLVLYDLAKNKKECTYNNVDYNIDKTSPEIVAKVYKCKKNGDAYVETGSVLATKTVNGTTPNATILSKDVSGNTNSWFNSNYPGLCYVFSVKDNIGVKSRLWQWNKSAQVENNSGYQTFNGADSPTEPVVYSNLPKSFDCTPSLTGEGHRYGRITIADQAGNTVYVNVEAKLDRTAPNVDFTMTSTNTSYNVQKVKVNVSTSDNSKYTDSKNMTMCYSTGSTCSSYSTLNTSFNYDFGGTLNGGKKSLTVFVKDKAGNVGKKTNNYTVAVTHKITYANEGGTGCNYKEVSHNSGDNTTWGDLCNPTKDGEKFDGWYTQAGGKGTLVTSSTKVTGDLTVHAKWRKFICTITYSPNGGTFTSNAGDTVQKLSYGDSTGDMRNSGGGYYSATKSGYHIIGTRAWTNGSSTFDQAKSYKAEQLCSNLKTGDRSVTLNANWVPDVSCPKVTAKKADGSSYTAGNWTNTSKIKFSFDFANTHATKYDWETDNGSGGWSHWNSDLPISTTSNEISGEGRRKIRIIVKDSDGLSKNCEYSNYLIDRTPPEVRYKCGCITPMRDWANTVLKFTDGTTKTYTSNNAENDLKNKYAKNPFPQRYTYMILIGYHDSLSKAKSRTLGLSDTIQYERNGHTYNWSHKMANINLTDGSELGLETPGSRAPMKVNIKNLCDYAGNCTYVDGYVITCPQPSTCPEGEDAPWW